MSDLIKALEKLIDERIYKILSEKGLALKLLEDFKDVDFLTFDEALKVFRVSEKKLLDGIKSGNVPRPQKIGKSPKDWRFSKRLIFDCLMGEWNPVKKEKQEKREFNGDNKYKNMASELTR